MFPAVGDADADMASDHHDRTAPRGCRPHPWRNTCTRPQLPPLSPSPPRTSAAGRVFALPELLEMVLLHLLDNRRGASEEAQQPVDHDHDRAAVGFWTLFPLQRVSRAFEATLLGSCRLQHHMFLWPLRGRSAGAAPSDDDVDGACARLRWFFDDFLQIRTTLCPPPTEQPRGNHELRLRRLLLHAHRPELSDVLRRLRGIAKRDASWRRIRIDAGAARGPPPIVVRFHVRVAARAPLCMAYVGHLKVVGRYRVLWQVECGDTLGRIFDRYLDVASRTPEEHVAAQVTQELISQQVASSRTV